MIIKNKDALSTTRLRKQTLDIIEAGIGRVLPPNIMKFAVKYDVANQILTINRDTYNISTRALILLISCLLYSVH